MILSSDIDVVNWTLLIPNHPSSPYEYIATKKTCWSHIRIMKPKAHKDVLFIKIFVQGLGEGKLQFAIDDKCKKLTREEIFDRIESKLLSSLTAQSMTELACYINTGGRLN